MCSIEAGWTSHLSVGLVTTLPGQATITELDGGIPIYAAVDDVAQFERFLVGAVDALYDLVAVEYFV